MLLMAHDGYRISMDTDDGCFWIPIISMGIEPMKGGRFCFWNTVLDLATVMN